MPWQDRVREMIYESPLGTRFVLTYENLREELDKKTTGFNFPDVDGTFVQDFGSTGRRYPVRLFFWGDDYDIEASAFMGALSESGIARLEMPLQGVIDVIPFGTITRRDDLKTASNQAVIQVTFWETTGIIYPTSKTDPAKKILSAIEEYNAASGEDLENILSLSSVLEQATFKSSYESVLSVANTTLSHIADAQEDVRTQFNAIADSINNGIDILISDPLTLALQTVQLIQSPARVFEGIKARLIAYSDLGKSITNGSQPVAIGLDSRGSNDFHTKDLFTLSYVSGAVVSVINAEFTTKIEALEAAEALITQLQEAIIWRDDNFESLAEIDAGGSYQQLQEAVALAAGFLVEISFSLKQERSIVLDRDRTIIDLSAELYGEIDSKLDFLISSNNLSGSEILELPRGREIAYYI